MVRLKVKEVAQHKKISQRQLFLRSGVDITTLQKIWRNPYTNITIEILGKLARGLGVDASELVEGQADLPNYMQE